MQLPGVSSDWERDAAAADLALVARAADELGFDHLTCSEHVAIPVDDSQAESGRRGVTYWDPLSTLGFWRPTRAASGWPPR